MVEKPSDKFISVYLLLEIVVLLAGVPFLPVNRWKDDALKMIMHKLKM